MLYPQNDDRIVAVHFVTSHRPMYRRSVVPDRIISEPVVFRRRSVSIAGW